MGCSSPPPTLEPEPELLVEHAGWQLVASADDDPFAEARGRPAVHACQSAAVFEVTPGTLEVELSYCRQRYVSLHQATAVGLNAGDSLHFTLAHMLLRPLTDDITEAYLALAINETVVWEKTIQILAVSNSYPIDIPISAAFANTSDIVLHLDNHGENSYTFTPFEIVRAGSN